MPTQKSVRYTRFMSKREFFVVALVAIAMLLSFGWMLGYHIGLDVGRDMPAPAKLIPPTEFAKDWFYGTQPAEDGGPWSDVLLIVDRKALLADSIADSDAVFTVKLLRPGV